MCRSHPPSGAQFARRDRRRSQGPVWQHRPRYQGGTVYCRRQHYPTAPRCLATIAAELLSAIQSVSVSAGLGCYRSVVAVKCDWRLSGGAHIPPGEAWSQTCWRPSETINHGNGLYASMILSMLSACNSSLRVQVALMIAGQHLPGSPLAVTVIPGPPCASGSIPSLLTAPFQACTALSTPVGAALDVTLPLRDCHGNRVTASQVRAMPWPTPARCVSHCAADTATDCHATCCSR
jgi:hypothetical protein